MADSIDWTDETPLRLKVAVERAFPNGGITVSGLRREAQRGRLVIEQIAGKDYTSLRAIADMRKLCRVEPSTAPTLRGLRNVTRSDLARASLDAALAKLDALRKSSKAGVFARYKKT